MSVDITFGNMRAPSATELVGRSAVEPGMSLGPAGDAAARSVFRSRPARPPLSSRSLPLTLAAIPGRLFSSLLPPSFVRGRFATFFFATRQSVDAGDPVFTACASGPRG
jgi:hypothetical protein